MTQKMIKPLVAAALVSAALAGTAQAQSTLRFSQMFPNTHPFQSEVLQVWANDVDKATQGRVKVEFTTAPLGPFPRNFDLAKTGVADITGGNFDVNPGRFPVSEITHLRVGSDDPEKVSVAYWRTFQRHLAAAKETDGVEVLSLGVAGSLQLMMVSKPVQNAADFRGLKLLAAGEKAAKMVDNLGGTGMFRPPTEIYDSLSKGVADGLFGSSSGILSYRLTDLIKQYVELPGGFYYSPIFIVMNKGKWDGLSAADRDAIKGVSGEVVARRTGAVMGRVVAAGPKTLQDQGKAQVTKASPELAAAINKAFAFVETDWLAAAKEKGVDGPAALAYFRAEAGAR